MEFGMPVLLELDSLKENASLCRELGLSFIELNMNLPEYQLEQLDVRRMQRISKEYGLFFTLHLDENLNVWDFNPKVAEAYMDTILSALRFAGKMGNIPVLNMHMAKGVSFTLPEGKVYLFEKYRGKYLENLKNFRRQCEKAASGRSIKICIENTDGYPSFLLDAISYLLESPLFCPHLGCGA